MKAKKSVFYKEPIIVINDPGIPIPDDPGIPIPDDPSWPTMPKVPISNKDKKIIDDVIRTYYRKNKKYGNLNISYDAPVITEIAQKVLTTSGTNVDSQQLQTEIEGNITSGAYKLSTDNDIFVYLFIAGIAIAVYFYFKSKKK
jgi:hypothetical protein